MVKNHLKRLNVPRTWNIKRKGIKYIMRPKPGPHNRHASMPLCVFLKELGVADTSREVRKLLFSKEVLVDGKARKDRRLPVGLFDVIEIKETKEIYRIMFNSKGKLTAVPIKADESNIKPYQIIGKTYLKNGKIQLNFSDGLNILVDKDEYKPMDAVVLELGTKKIKEHIKFDKGVFIYITGGKHLGNVGVLDDVKGDKIIFKDKSNIRIETLKQYAFVLGRDKSIIEIVNN